MSDELGGLAKNSRFILTGTLSGINRIPDFVDEATKTIYEAKNVSALSYTPQISDMATWAEQNGFTFQIYVREGAKLTTPLLQALQNGLLTINELPFP